MATGVRMRRATPEDDAAILGLLSRTLGWENDDRHRSLFAWKHRENPYGPSPGWVAFDDEGLVGARLFMRWAFRTRSDLITAVRAVDTATDPRAQRQGIFRALTMRGVEELSATGVGWVFNTPNDQSAPGYESMGWQRVGRLPVAFRPEVRGIPRLVFARRPADLWSLPTSAGDEAQLVLEDAAALEELSGSVPTGRSRVHTDRTAAYLRWRYGAGPVTYRALLHGSTVQQGVVFFRLRRRGPAAEAVIADVLIPGGDRRVAARLCRLALQAAAADYGVGIGSARPAGWIPIPSVGPLLMWRALACHEPPPSNDWQLTTGDIELF
jgi:hypothetical protein